MNRTLLSRRITRRGFLQGLALTTSAGLLPAASVIAKPMLPSPLPGPASADLAFFTGLNFPWMNYGRDFGMNAWGYDGINFSGWVPQTRGDSQGFIGARVVKGYAHAGTHALRITADMAAGDKNKSKGEVYVDLTQNAPPGISTPLNLTGKTATCWLYFPAGSAGTSNHQNGIQLFFKSKQENSETWYSWYSQWVNIQKSWEGTYRQFSASPSETPGYVDPLFDKSKVIAVGIKVGLNDKATSGLKGYFYMDDYQINTTPPVLFDFEHPRCEKDLVITSCKTSLLRVFILCDGRSAPEFTATGAVVGGGQGLDIFFFDDFDALLELAALLRFKLIPVLLDFHWCDSATAENGVQKGGRSAVIRDPAIRQTFLDNALQPLIQRYANASPILAWDIINEPEWAIIELAPDSDVGDKVTLVQMQDFIKACADQIHAINPSLRVTVGSARRKWVENWKGLGLDLYQFHWYDKFAPEEPFPWAPCAALGLDQPCFIGEVPTKKTSHTVGEYLAAAQAGGYAGLLPWSYRAEDDVSDFSAVMGPLGRQCAPLPLVVR